MAVVKTRKVFLDANVVISAGRPPGGPELERVRDLVHAGLVRILTTDLTVAEVAKKHAENDYDVVKEIGRSHFRKLVEEVVGTKLPDVSKTKLKEKLTASYSASTNAMFKGLGAKTLPIDKIKPSTVLDAYTAGDGFFTGEGKKDQFPDAFIFECLKKEASAKEPIIIVSSDGDFEGPVKLQKNITLVKSLPDLFAKLGLELEAPELDAFLEANKEELREAIDKELAGWSLVGDVEDSEIEDTEVTDVEITKLTAFKPMDKGSSLLVVGRVKVKAHASYTHPDWDNAAYDSEDKRLIPFEDVSGKTDLELDIDISLSVAVDDDGNPSQIEELRFRNSNFLYVELHPVRYREYM